VIAVSLTETEHEAVAAVAAKAGLSPSTYARTILLGCLVGGVPVK